MLKTQKQPSMRFMLLLYVTTHVAQQRFVDKAELEQVAWLNSHPPPY